jgi:transcriptional regulator with XRE-family HTH domain
LIEQDVLNRIQQLLEFKHWTLYKLAKESNIAYSSLNNIFNRQTCPTIVTLEKICKGFNMSLSEFFAFNTNPLRNESLTFEQQDLLNSYDELSSQDKLLLKAYLKGLCKK